MTKYYIFGIEAVESYYYADVEHTRELLKAKRGKLIKHPPDVSTSAIMRELLGWDDFTEITEKDYEQLKNYTNEN